MDLQRTTTSAAEIGRSLIAGLAGTAAMSLTQRIEMALTGRGPSATPAEALCLLLGFETRTEAEEQRLAEEAHWAYGTGWGLGHSALRRVPEPARSLVYLAAVWGAGAALLTATRLAPPPTEWSTQSLLSDLAHHAVYAAVGGLVYGALGRMMAAQEDGRQLEPGLLVKSSLEEDLFSRAGEAVAFR